MSTNEDAVPEGEEPTVPPGTPGHLPIDEYRPPPPWLRDALDGPFPRKPGGGHQVWNAETEEWEDAKPEEG